MEMIRGKILKLGALLATVMLFGAVLVGCGTDEKEQDDPKKNVQTEEQQKTTDEKNDAEKKNNGAKEHTFKLYYPTTDGMKLKQVKAKIKAKENDKYVATVKALMETPKEAGLTTIFPKGTKVRSIKVEKNIATVDFSKELTQKFRGGSTGEEMLVGALVNTLTEFKEIHKVRILVEGEEIESIGGHMDLTEPLDRMEELL